jgi:tartrate-resistant acid phosphatase type 5
VFYFSGMKKPALYAVLVIAAAFYSSCAKMPITQVAPVNVPADKVVFAVIGDYGSGSDSQTVVANMVKSWNPEFIITTGDNNYFLGAKSTIAKNIGRDYCEYIYNPDAPDSLRCNGKAAQEKVNRFFPSPGNHDYYSSPKMKPYLKYFTLPGDERNYQFTWGPVSFYSINSGVSGHVKCCDSREATWLQNALQQSKSAFKFVYFHHPPYSVSSHGSSEAMRWPFADWKVDAVFNGHDHVYERIIDKAQPKPVYIVCGNSGTDRLYGCNANPLDSTKYDVTCDAGTYGAVRVTVTATKAIMEYFVIGDMQNPRDVYIINK